MRVLVTGAHGFVGRNLQFALVESENHEVLAVTRQTSAADLRTMIATADAVIHLAGVNRPSDPAEFDTGNSGFTKELCGLLTEGGKATPVAFASSIQAAVDNPYGRSKQLAEEHLRSYAVATGAPVAIYRLPNVFGKWCRPNYNSAVATFCHRLTRGEPLTIHDPAANVRLVYVDDVVRGLLDFLAQPPTEFRFVEISPEYSLTVGELAEQLRAFNTARQSLVTERVGEGLVRALYATYVSYLPPEDFSYPVAQHADHRGVFVEMLKTKDSGQFSFFTALPGVTRGGHYHHTKTEKFLVIKGNARFNFRHIVTDERHTIESHGNTPMIVETVPGWAHDITNVGEGELVVLLWANEIFDRENPDTFASKV